MVFTIGIDLHKMCEKPRPEFSSDSIPLLSKGYVERNTSLLLVPYLLFSLARSVLMRVLLLPLCFLS